MKSYEKIKIFKGVKLEKVEEDYATWYKELSDAQKNTEISRALEINSREVALHSSGKSLGIVIVVFYVSYDLGNTGSKVDSGKHLDSSGASAFGRKGGKWR